MLLGLISESPPVSTLGRRKQLWNLAGAGDKVVQGLNMLSIYCMWIPSNKWNWEYPIPFQQNTSRFRVKICHAFYWVFFLMVKCPGNPGNKLCKTWSLISIGKQDHWFESIFANMKYHEISIELLKQLSVSIWSLGMMWSYNSHTYIIHDFWTMNSEPWETSKQTKSAWSFGL